MTKLNDSPKVLIHKIYITVFIGVACLLVGIAYGIAARDRIFFALSCAVLAFSLFRAYTLYRIVTKGKYEVVEGTCVGLAQKLFKRQFTVRVMDDDGIETTLRLGKQAKIKIGTRYRFYFKQSERTALNNAYFDSMTASDMFLGFEMTEDKQEIETK